jgi:hypothetical protein
MEAPGGYSSKPSTTVYSIAEMAQKASKKWTSSQVQIPEISRFFTLLNVQILFPRKVKNWSFERSSKTDIQNFQRMKEFKKRELDAGGCFSVVKAKGNNSLLQVILYQINQVFFSVIPDVGQATQDGN